MLPRSSPDGIHIAFDDHRLVNNAGLILPATLAQHLGLPQLVQECLDLGAGPSQHRRQDDDPGGVRAGWWRLHRRRRRVAHRQHARLRNIIEAIPEEDWTPIPYWMDGAADVAETTYTPFRTEPDASPARLIVRRVKPTPGSQLALFAAYRYHGFITDRDGDPLGLEADHRRHDEIENAIRDLKYGVGLNHLPSGRFAANPEPAEGGLAGGAGDGA